GNTSKQQRPSTTRNNNNPKDDAYELFYLQSPNVGLSEDAVQARKERETASLKTLQEKLFIPTLTLPTLRDVQHFLTHDHALYTAHKLVDRGRGSGGGDNGDQEASDQVKKSYGGG
ncbi:MAG: hypothetical protein SGARI_008218, partial [Bacillariaceae sp.]